MTTVAVIGCGRIAAARHFPALASIKDVRIKYACDIIPEKAEAIKEKYPDIEYAITDYNVALADPEVEAVWVLTPNYVHYTATMAALKAGKHVFCEKPITVNYPLSLEMKEAADKAGKMLNIGVCNRYQESVERIKETKIGFRLGKSSCPRNVTGHYHRVALTDHRVPIFFNFRNVALPPRSEDLHRLVG
jgi:predicted dehydrogenase